MDKVSKEVPNDCPQCGNQLFAKIAIRITKNPSEEDKICPAVEGGFWGFNILNYHCKTCNFSKRS